MTMLRYICNRDYCRYTSCKRHPNGHDENTPRLDLCGSGQCLSCKVEDDGYITIHPRLK